LISLSTFVVALESTFDLVRSAIPQYETNRGRETYVPNPAGGLDSLRITKKDLPKIDPFAIDEAEAIIAAVHTDWGEAQGNYDEFRFFTGLRPSEQIALLVSDCDFVRRKISV